MLIDIGTAHDLPAYEQIPSTLSSESQSQWEDSSFDTNDRFLYNIDQAGNVLSHDPTLSSDPRALYDFLKLHSTSPPSLSIQIKGSHRATRERNVYSDGQNHSQFISNITEDFNFWIHDVDLVSNGLGSARGVGGMKGYLYQVGPWEAVYRGGSRVATQIARNNWNPSSADEEKNAGRWVHPSRSRKNQLLNAKKERDAAGLPRFINPRLFEPTEPAGPSLLADDWFLDIAEVHSSFKTILPDFLKTFSIRDTRGEDVIDDYCMSQATFKELRIEKEFYGWNWKALHAAILKTIFETNYDGQVSIEFKISPSNIIIRPDNWATKLFSIPVPVKIFLWILLIYPIFLLVELFAGERYQNLRLAFPLARWRRVPSTFDTPVKTEAQATALLARQIGTAPEVRLFELHPSTPGFFMYFAGTAEGAWLKKWEKDIGRGVLQGLKGELTSEALTAEMEWSMDPRLSLRGYKST